MQNPKSSESVFFKKFLYFFSTVLSSSLITVIAIVGVFYLFKENQDFKDFFAEMGFQTAIKNIQINNTTEDSALIMTANSAVDGVVSVLVYKDDKALGSGSGFFVDKSGLLITNKHVLEGGNRHQIVLHSGEVLEVEKVWLDPSLDLAVLKINPQKIDLKVLQIGNSDLLQLGQSVVAIGNSLGEFSNTVSAGIVSALSRRILASNSNNVFETGGEILENVIQTDASINSGNSGGPLLNLAGEVVAVNVAKSNTGENIGFAIPSSVLPPIIYSVKNYDKIKRPYIGIKYLAIYPELAEKNKLSTHNGVWLHTEDGSDSVMKDSPAEKAGLKEGDIILEFSQKTISLNNSLAFLVRKHSPGDTVELLILRGEKTHKVSLVLGEFEE